MCIPRSYDYNVYVRHVQLMTSFQETRTKFLPTKRQSEGSIPIAPGLCPAYWTWVRARALSLLRLFSSFVQNRTHEHICVLYVCVPCVCVLLCPICSHVLRPRNQWTLNHKLTVCRVLATCDTKAPCARAVWGRPDSPLGLVNEALSTLENLV